MNKVTFRLPSKAVQYGYTEVELDVSGPVDYNVLGEDYARYVQDFWNGEKGTAVKVDSAAVKEFEKQLGATKVSEEMTEESPTDQSGKPWDKPASSSGKKPWEKSNKPDLFG